jgi:hypothetical protein
MIILKIYFTAMIVLAVITGVSTALMNADNKRTDMWWNIAKISWSTLLAMVVAGSIVCILVCIWID